MPVTLRADFIGSLAAEALSVRDSGIVAEVVNIFSNSFYMRTINDELIFVTNRSLKSPVTINLEATSSLERLVRPLEPLYVHQKKILSSAGASIDLRGAMSVATGSDITTRRGLPYGQLAESLLLVSFIIKIIDTSQSVLDPNSLIHRVAVDFVREGVIPLRSSWNEQGFREAALKIVGLGSGFTPSGDDLLGGFLAVYNSFAGCVGRPQIQLDFSLLEHKTSWISAKLLEYMQTLVLDDQIKQLISSAARGDGDAFLLALETLLPRGHTSGIDICTGTILALSLILEIALQNQMTETISQRLGLQS